MSAKKFSYSEFFFDSKKEVRRLLASKVFKKLEKDGWEFRRMDELCGFSEKQPQLPTCGQVQEDNERLNCAFFSRAAYPLRLTFNKALPLDPERLARVLPDVKREMLSKNARAVSGFPAFRGPTKEFTCLSEQRNRELSDEEAKVYIWLKIADEIDVIDQETAKSDEISSPVRAALAGKTERGLLSQD